MRRYLVLSIVTILPLCCGPFSSRADPLQYAAAPLHGGFPYSAETRERIARNRRVLGEIAAALAGQRRWPYWFSPTQGLWWLAESGRAEYLPLFLRYSEPAGPRWPVGARRDCLGCHPGTVTTIAAYGLARHAARPEAARRLRELLAARTDTHSTRYNVVTLLAVVNDTATRVLLREISRDRSTERARAWPLWEDALRRADSALATPALPPGHGRVPPLRPVASSQLLVPDARTAIQAEYERLADAIRRNDVEEILAIQAPGFSSINHRGMTSDYVAMERYTRQMTAAVDSVIHIRKMEALPCGERARDALVRGGCARRSISALHGWHAGVRPRAGPAHGVWLALNDGMLRGVARNVIIVPHNPTSWWCAAMAATLETLTAGSSWGGVRPSW